MGDAAQEKAAAEVRKAQTKYEKAKNQLDSAGDERRESFERARAAGLSLAQIGNAAGLHRTRIDQILRGK